MTVRNHKTHDCIDAVCAEFRLKLVKAFNQAIYDYEHIYPHNNPANLITSDMNRLCMSIRDLISVMVIEPWSTRGMEEIFHQHKKKGEK